MRSQNFWKGLMLSAVMFLFILGAVVPATAELNSLQQLGKKLFFDANLSTPPGMSCASCHAPEAGWTGPQSSINAAGAIYPGVVHTRAGNRKPPSSAYGGASPVMYYDKIEEMFLGGMFWDGRATGWALGDPLQEQALGPFLNPVEQNNPKERLVLIKIILQSPYAELFIQEYSTLYGVPAKKVTPGTMDVQKFYQFVGYAIAAYERSAEVNPFSSKYDFYLKDPVQFPLTDQEEAGLALFNDPQKGNCAACHPSTSKDNKPLFTDFSYDNLGVPKNPLNPFYFQTKKINPMGENWVDLGLGGFLATTKGTPDDYSAMAEINNGKHKVPTLRNVDLRPTADFVKAYGHNGYFKSLEEIVHFYNTRDVQTWPAPEVAANVNSDELGNLGLSPAEEAAIVAFLKTLSDGYQP